MKSNTSKPSARTYRAQPLELHYIVDEYHNCVRVWRNDWPNDTFEMLAKVTFERVKEICTLFSIPLIEQMED